MKPPVSIPLVIAALVPALLPGCGHWMPRSGDAVSVPDKEVESATVKTKARSAPAEGADSVLDIPCLAPCIGRSAFKAFGESTYFWKQSERMNLTVSFKGGSSSLRKRVQKVAGKWITEGGAGVKFVFLTEGEGRIRVAFGDSGHWSRVGRSALNANKADPTMNLMVTDSTKDDELQRVVLHEFGHALGLMHEHRQPGNPIIWDEPVVRAWYKGEPNYWEDPMIDEQVFKPYISATAISNGYDPTSIMQYPILEGWSKNKPPIVVGWNYELSASDKALISSARVYPKQ